MTQENSNPTEDANCNSSENTCSSATAKSKREQSQRWTWLQERLASTATLDNWIHQELESLENDFADMVTPGSLSRSLRSDR